MGMKLPPELQATILARADRIDGKPLGKTIDTPGQQNIFIPVRVVSEANQREYFMAKYRRKSEQQDLVTITLAAKGFPRDWPGQLRITLTKIGGYRCDQDNRAGAFKHVVDALFRWIGRDDGERDIKFFYEWKPKPRHGLAGVTIEIESKKEST